MVPLSADVLNVPEKHATIEEAVEASQDGDTILIEPGIYVIDALDGVLIEKSITLRAVEGPGHTVLRGTAGRCLRIEYVEGPVEIEGLTFESTNAQIAQPGWSSAGGAIYSKYCDHLSINNCVFEKLAGSYGGAIYTVFTKVSLKSSRFQNNEAQFGGAVHSENGNVLVEDSVFVGNNAFYGGATFLGGHTSVVTVKRSVFRSNSARLDGAGNGGALYLYLSQNVQQNHLIEDCLFDNNLAAHGGAVYAKGVIGSTSRLDLQGNTVVNNVALDSGSGLFCEHEIDVHVVNSIYWDRSANDPIVIESLGTVEYSIVRGGHPGLGNLSLKPHFMALRKGDFRLLKTSPGVDAGNGDNASDHDLNGLPRIDLLDVVNTGAGDPNYVDMGCYETQR